MSEGIQPGLKGEKTTIVNEHNVAGHVDKFSTPHMIQLMERASIAALEPALASDQTSVGYEVHVRHLAPTPIGMKVRATSELVEVNGNKLVFRVEAQDEEKKIGEGTHKRAIVKRTF